MKFKDLETHQQLLIISAIIIAVGNLVSTIANVVLTAEKGSLSVEPKPINNTTGPRAHDYFRQ